LGLQVIKIAYIAWPCKVGGAHWRVNFLPQFNILHPISSIEKLFSVELYIHFLLHIPQFF